MLETFVKTDRNRSGIYMTTACVAIIIIVLISSFMCTRHGYRAIGQSILPIALVPLGHIIGSKLLLI